MSENVRNNIYSSIFIIPQAIHIPNQPPYSKPLHKVLVQKGATIDTTEKEN